MTEDELTSIIGREISQSVGYFDGKLADQRRKSMDYYLGEPYGNEVEGRSSFVSRDIAETIEGIMPSIMKIFASTDEVVKFDPQGPEDEEGAIQASDYTNYVFWRQNPGFVILHTFFKDALLQKNGFAKVYWDEYQKRKVEEYSNLTPDEVAMLYQQLQKEGEVEVETDGETYKFTCQGKYGKVCIDPIPPEEIRVNRNAKFDLQKERFVCHERRMTASDLREMGIDEDVISELETADSDFNQERNTRFRYDQEDTWDNESSHESTQEYLVRECYMLVDFDGDGIAERRMVLESGKKILTKNGEPCNVEIDRVPIVTTTPILMPHKLFGLSIADLISDLQLLKSTLLRQILDNMYLTNNSRMMALDGMVNIDDLLTVRPGGVVRVKTFDAVKPLQVPFFGAPAFQMLGYVDQTRETRTGQRHFMGVDADALNKDVSGAALDSFKAAAMDRIELIARIFAETGVKDMMWAIYELICKHERKEKVVRLRNKWVQIDPRSWSTRFDMTVTVGLGTGSKQQTINGAQLIGTFQEKIAQLGGMGRVVTEQNVYSLAKEAADAVFPKKGHLFFTDPSGMPPPEEKPDPKIELMKYKADLQDKTKRDTKSVDLMLEVARLKQESDKTGVEAEDKQEERNFKEREAVADRGMQMEQFNRQDESMRKEAQDQAVQESKATIDDMASGQQQVLQAQQQLLEAIQQMTRVMAAPKRLITDERGEPIGAEPVL